MACRCSQRFIFRLLVAFWFQKKSWSSKKLFTGENEGAIELSLHGDNYPKKHSDFPTKTYPVKVGDIVFFPSSVFHRTIPFSSKEERICIAFDVRPQLS